jgi:predicted TIM-barrel fold metal-dependent hydrolase
MQLIDANCMLGEWTFKNLRLKEPNEMLNEMRRLGIAKSLVFHSRSWLYDIKSGNMAIIEAVRNYSNSLIPVIALTPLIEQEFGGKKAVIHFIKANRVGAVRLFPTDHNFTFELWSVDKLFSTLDEMHMLVLIEGRELTGSINSHYAQIYELARRYKNVNIVLLTVGYTGLRTMYGLFDKCPNIHIDTSTFITFHGIEDVVKHFGSERILFGSRMPFIEGGVSVGRLLYADLEAADKDNIAYRNILRLLGHNKSLFPHKEALST